MINLPANKVLLRAHAFLYTLMDFFQSHMPKPLLSSFFHIPDVQLQVKRLAGSQRAEIDPNLLTLTKCYSKVAHSAIDGLLSVRTKLCPSRLLSYLLPYSQNVQICTGLKRLAGSPKG
jgi:hypothetical protein